MRPVEGVKEVDRFESKKPSPEIAAADREHEEDSDDKDLRQFGKGSTISSVA